MPEELKRREILKLTAGTLLAARMAVSQEHKFLTPAEFAMTEELTEILIPADESSPGARAAKVTEYLDGSLAEAFDDEERQQWRQGLAAVDALSQRINHVPFLKGTLPQRQDVMLEMARNEKDPKAPEELFFRTLKGATVRAYYTSKIGIHNDLDYKGNVYQPGEYAGILPVGPALGGGHNDTK